LIAFNQSQDGFQKVTNAENIIELIKVLQQIQFIESQKSMENATPELQKEYLNAF
jgi:hypothetical protein